MTITIVDLVRVSLSRCARWHPKGIHDWSSFEWTGAVAGEVGEAIGALLDVARHSGEACNAAKKLKRVESEMANLDSRELDQVTEQFKVLPHDESLRMYKEQVAKECADIILYAVLAMAKTGLSPLQIEDTIRQVFNQKSVEYGFPERL